MLVIKNVLFFAVASAFAAVIRRSAADVLADITTIDEDTRTFTRRVNSWHGGLIGGLRVRHAGSKLKHDVEDAASDANDVDGTIDDGYFRAIIKYINDTLEPDIAASMQALEVKKSQIQHGGHDDDVLRGLRNSKSRSASLGAALAAKAPMDQQSAISDAQTKINSDFDAGIAAFS